MHTERQKWIDAARGIAILLMLWGHNSNDIFTHWLYYFHMPLFVFISGYVFSPKADYIECLKSQLKRLYIPYIVYFSIDFFLNWAYEFLIYSNHPIIPRFWKRTYEIILPLYGTGTTNGLWFLISLSWILLLAQCILTRKIYIKWMIVIFAIISYMGIWGGNLSKDTFSLPFFMYQAMALSIFFYLGYVSKLSNIINKTNIWTMVILVMMSSSIISIYTLNCPQIDYYKLLFPINFLSLVCCGLLGTISIIYISKIMIHFDYPCKYMIQIGQMTLFYLGMHGAVYRYLSLFLKIFIKNDNFIFYIARYVLAVAIIYIISRVIIVFCKKYQLERITNYVGLK